MAGADQELPMSDRPKSVPLPTIPGQFRFTPEFRLLVACSWIAPAHLEALQSEKIVSLCGEEIDWDEFIALVDRHRIPALAYAALSRHAGGRLPERAREILKGRSDQCRREALQLAAETVRLAKRFAGEGIDMLPLKGPLLSLQLFGDVGMRQSRDIDVMVKPADLDRADRLLAAEGYRRTFPDFPLSPRQKKYVGYQHYGYVHSVKGLQLELHWRIDPWTPEQVAELWNHCRSQNLTEIGVTCLDDDLLLLYLCDHGAHHEWFRLKWLSDILAILGQEYPTVSDKLLDLTDRFDLRRPLAQAALMAHWLYGIPLTAPLSTLISEEKTVLPLSLAAVKALQMDEKTTHALLERWLEGVRSLWYRMRLRSHPHVGTHLKRVMIITADFKNFPLPDRLFWLYSALRPLFWFWRHYNSPTEHIPDSPTRHKSRN
jgi:hypothetical protein